MNKRDRKAEATSERLDVNYSHSPLFNSTAPLNRNHAPCSLSLSLFPLRPSVTLSGHAVIIRADCFRLIDTLLCKRAEARHRYTPLTGTLIAESPRLFRAGVPYPRIALSFTFSRLCPRGFSVRHAALLELIRTRLYNYLFAIKKNYSLYWLPEANFASFYFSVFILADIFLEAKLHLNVSQNKRIISETKYTPKVQFLQTLGHPINDTVFLKYFIFKETNFP